NCRARDVNCRDLLSAARQVQSEAAMKGEAVERLAARVAFGGDAVLALVEEGAGLLTFEQVHGKAHAVFFTRQFAGVCAVERASQKARSVSMSSKATMRRLICEREL